MKTTGMKEQLAVFFAPIFFKIQIKIMNYNKIEYTRD